MLLEQLRKSIRIYDNNFPKFGIEINYSNNRDIMLFVKQRDIPLSAGTNIFSTIESGNSVNIIIGQLSSQISRRDLVNREVLHISNSLLNVIPDGSTLYYLVADSNLEPINFRLNSATVKDRNIVEGKTLCLYLIPGEESLMQEFPFFFDEKANIVGYCSQTLNFCDYWVMSKIYLSDQGSENCKFASIAIFSETIARILSTTGINRILSTTGINYVYLEGYELLKNLK